MFFIYSFIRTYRAANAGGRSDVRSQSRAILAERREMPKTEINQSKLELSEPDDGSIKRTMMSQNQVRDFLWARWWDECGRGVPECRQVAGPMKGRNRPANGLNKYKKHSVIYALWAVGVPPNNIEQFSDIIRSVMLNLVFIYCKSCHNQIYVFYLRSRRNSR